MPSGCYSDDPAQLQDETSGFSVGLEDDSDHSEPFCKCLCPSVFGVRASGIGLGCDVYRASRLFQRSVK